MTSVQIAEALLRRDGAAALVALLSSGRRCDAVPVRVVLLRMFPDVPCEDLEAGLRLAISIARLDDAEAKALGEGRPLP